MLTSYGKRIGISIIIILIGIMFLSVSYMPEPKIEEVAQPKEDTKITSANLNRIFNNYKWSADDMQWNIERISTIVNKHYSELRSYDRPIIVNGKNLNSREDPILGRYNGIVIEFNGNVISQHQDDSSTIMPSVSGVIESGGETVLFQVRTDRDTIDNDVTVVGTLVGYVDDVPFVMGVLR